MDYHSVALQFKLGVIVNTPGTTVLIVLLLVLLLFSFMLSGAEVAFFSLTHKDINNLKTKQQNVYRRIVELLDEPKKLLGSLLIANSFINTAIIIISNILIDDLINFNAYMQWAEFLIKVVIVTFLLVMFGEVLPKVMATQNNIRFAKDVGGFVELVSYVFGRLSNWLVKYSDVIERKLSNKKNSTLISS